MKCVVCVREGGSNFEGVITLQSTPSGMVCPSCIYRLVKSEIYRTTNVISPSPAFQENHVSPDRGNN